jgi:cell wall-associated NlpC family hydrolase
MVSLDCVQLGLVYQTRGNLDLYDSEARKTLATQATAGRYLRVQTLGTKAAQVRLCEDDYPGWIALPALAQLQTAPQPYSPLSLSMAEIQARLPQVIAFAQQAQTQPNYYLWGGTLGPNYDCSGLVQHAFAAVGIWLPRDAYQQEAFTQAVALPDLQPGDLIFFGLAQKATHVGIYLGEQAYIHSSGKDQGRNGIGIDFLTPEGEPVTRTYFQQLRGAGRVVASYQPQP